MSLVVPSPIETGRLVVRHIAIDDLPALLSVNGDDEVTRFLPYATWTSMADAEAWWGRTRKAESSGSAVQFVILDKPTGRAIGSCLLFRYEEGSRRAELGYVMGRPHWRGGYMREALVGLIDAAFCEMNLRRVEAEVDTRNLPSIGLLRSLGFTKEGVLRQRWVSKGEAKDVEAYGLLSHEWPRATGPDR